MRLKREENAGHVIRYMGVLTTQNHDPFHLSEHSIPATEQVHLYAFPPAYKYVVKTLKHIGQLRYLQGGASRLIALEGYLGDTLSDFVYCSSSQWLAYNYNDDLEVSQVRSDDALHEISKVGN
jgi:hypothetical protein